MTIPRRLALTVATLLTTSPALATVTPPAPRLVPLRDVTVDYQVVIPNQQPLEVRVAIAAGGTRLRILGEDLPTSFLVDRQTETAAIVLPMLKTYTRVSIARYDPAQTVLRGAGFSRGGRGEVAGLPCTHWQSHSAQGHADACITADGVILAGSMVSDRKGNLGEIRALRATYAPLPPDIFAVPTNYHESPLAQAAANFMK
jgi:hypothetical protein